MGDKRPVGKMLRFSIPRTSSALPTQHLASPLNSDDINMKLSSHITLCLGLIGMATAAAHVSGYAFHLIPSQSLEKKTSPTNESPQAGDPDVSARNEGVMQMSDGSLVLVRGLEGLEKRQGCKECPCSGWDPSTCCCPHGVNCCNHCNTCP